MSETCKSSMMFVTLLLIHANADAAFERKIDTSKAIYSMEVSGDGFRALCRDTSSIKLFANVNLIKVVDSSECLILSSKIIVFDSNGVSAHSQMENGYLLFSGIGGMRFSIFSEDLKKVNHKEESLAGEPGVFKKIVPLAAPYLIASGVLLVIAYVSLMSGGFTNGL